MNDSNTISPVPDSTTPRYRYPGILPFTQQQERIFFGRDQEIEILYKSVLQNPCTVIFGKSGIGKSSLISAGLLPRIEEQNKKNSHNYRVISTFRFGAYGGPSERAPLIVKFNSVLPDVITPDNFFPDFTEEIKKSIWYKLKSQQFTSYSNNKSESFILIFDQLEQLFTYPDDQIKQFLFALSDLLSPNVPDNVEEAFEEMKEQKTISFSKSALDVLRTPTPIKLLLSIRSDKLNLITRLSKSIPSLMRNVYELLPLSGRDAKLAIIKPAQDEKDFVSPPFSYDKRLLDNIIDFGRQNGNEATVSDDEKSIEPFNLQIICSHIEKSLDPKVKGRTITIDEVGALENIINEYISDKLKETFPEELKRVKVITIICSRFIDETNKVRKMVYAHDLRDNESDVEKLCDTGLIRKETRGQREVYFELSHDKLIDPILKTATNQSVQLKQQGDISYAQEKYLDAIKAYGKYLETIKETDIAAAEVYLSMGDAHAKLKNYSESNKDYKSALKLKPGDAGILFRIAMNYFSLGKDDKVEKYIESAVDSNPNYAAETYNEIGVNYYNAKLEDYAKNYFEKAITRNPGFSLPYFNIALVYNNRKQSQLARTNLETCIKLDPHFANALYELGNTYFDEGANAKAQEYFNKVLSLDPAHYFTYFQLGVIEIQQKNYEKAISYLTDAIKANAAYENAYQQRSVALARLGKYEEGIKDLETMIGLNPASDLGYSTLGWIYINTPDYDKAIKNLELAISIKPTANSFYNLGIAKGEKKMVDEAIKCFKESVKLDPDYVLSYEKLFSSLLEQNQYDEVIKWQNSHLQMPHSDKTYCTIGEAFYYKKDFGKAKEFLLKAIELNPSNIDGHIFMAYIETDDNKPEDALKYYDKLIEIVPNAAFSYSQAGKLLEGLGRHDEAIKYFKNAIEKEPNLENAWVDLGNVYYGLNEIDNARINYEKAIELNPHMIFAYYNLGLIATRNQDPDAALSYYKKILDIAPAYLADNSDEPNSSETIQDALMNIGDIYMYNKNDNEQAKVYFGKLLEMNPHNSFAYYSMGLAEYRMQHPAEAMYNYEKAIEANPQNDEAYFEIGNIKLDEENYEDAILYFETAVRYNPNNADAYINLGHCYFNLNPFERVEKFSKKAIEIDPNSSNTYVAYNNLAEAQVKLEKYDEALANCMEAKKLNPESDAVNATLGEIYEKLNKIEDAITYYKESLKLNPSNPDAQKRLQALEKA